MVVETTGEQAVPWTKPADWEFDLKKPFAKLNFDPAGNFNALFADGAVLRLRRDIGEEMMAAILTIAGGELVTDLDNR